MAETLEALRAEHRNMARALGLLEQQLALFEAASEPDYELIGQIIDYFRQFPELYHHPKEELVLEYLKERAPEQARRIGDLKGEHEACSDFLQNFTRLFVGVLMGMEIPREEFSRAARAFIDNERRHMDGEQELFFPIVQQNLTAEDWRKIDERAHRFRDPLDRPDKYFHFDLLRERLAEQSA